MRILVCDVLEGINYLALQLKKERKKKTKKKTTTTK